MNIYFLYSTLVQNENKYYIFNYSGEKKKKYKRSAAGWRKQQQRHDNYANRISEKERQMAEWAKHFNEDYINTFNMIYKK